MKSAEWQPLLAVRTVFGERRRIVVEILQHFLTELDQIVHIGQLRVGSGRERVYLCLGLYADADYCRRNVLTLHWHERRGHGDWRLIVLEVRDAEDDAWLRVAQLAQIDPSGLVVNRIVKVNLKYRTTTKQY